MACLEKPALPVCVLLIRGKLVVFYVFRWVNSHRRGRKMGNGLPKALQAHFKSGPTDDECLSYRSEFINCFLLILLAWVQHHRGEVGAIGRIGEVLCLKANATSSWEGGSMLPFVAVGPIVGVELYARFGGIYLHRAARYRLHNPCGKA